PPPPPSFPTRRSSDLAIDAEQARSLRTFGPVSRCSLAFYSCRQEGAVGNRVERMAWPPSVGMLFAKKREKRAVLDPSAGPEHPRSEEHTSELQSRSDL